MVWDGDVGISKIYGYSGLWWGTVFVQQVFASYIVYGDGFGDGIFFWFNTWFDNPSLAVQLQILFNYARDCQAKVCKFMD